MPGELDLDKFEHLLALRPLTSTDFEQLIEMQLLCFPTMAPWTRAHVESQIANFPEGQLVVEYEGRVVASCATVLLDSEEHDDWHNWQACADDGYIRNHTYSGDVLYGIEMMVHPEYRGMRLARRLYNERKELARRMNAQSIIIGGRIPGYHEHADRLSAREYVDDVVARKLYDPVLTTQLANGFALKRLIPNYLPTDTESLGYATFLEWNNLDYQSRTGRTFRATAVARIALVQYSMRNISDFSEFATQAEFFIDAAADQKSDFVVFPELFTTQLLSVTPPARSEDAARQLAAYTPRYLALFTELAVRYNVNLIAGSQFTEEDGLLYNVAYLFRRDGTIEKQYKLHITPEERKWWGVQPGDAVHVFECDRGRIAMLVGYDIEFPEIVRWATEMGAQLIFVPFNVSDRSGYLRLRYCAQARAVENHVYVATAGAVGNLPFAQNADIHYAQSAIFTPCDVEFARDGVAAECNPNIEMLVTQDVDLELLRRNRQTGTERNWLDRRTDVYRVVIQNDGKTTEV